MILHSQLTRAIITASIASMPERTRRDLAAQQEGARLSAEDTVIDCIMDVLAEGESCGGEVAE
jgi:hypothetical protein